MRLNIGDFISSRSKSILLCVASILVLNVSLLSATWSKGKIEKKSYFYDKAKREIDYSLYVPSEYDGSKKAPLIVLLHGLGSNPHQVIRYSGVVQEAEKRGYVVVAPYGYNERGWYGSRGTGKEGLLFGEQGDPDNLGELSQGDVFNVLGIVTKELNIDENRIYLTGHSMGGGGAIYLGGTFPRIWAGIAPMAPAVFFDSSILKKMPQMPIYIVAGELDLLVPVGSVRRWAQQMKELKMDYYYNEIPGGDHNSSFTNNPEMISQIYDFFDKHQKDAEKSLSSHKVFRVFTNRSGVQIKASIQSVTEEKVAIVRKDGRKFTLSLSTLSDADREFLKEWRDSRKSSRD